MRVSWVIFEQTQKLPPVLKLLPCTNQIKNKEVQSILVPPHTLPRYAKAAQMCTRLRRQIRIRKSYLSCGPWRIHCPSVGAIWLPAPNTHTLNTSRWQGSRNVLFSENSIKRPASRKLWDHWSHPLVQGHKHHFLTKAFLLAQDREKSSTNCKTFMIYYAFKEVFSASSISSLRFEVQGKGICRTYSVNKIEWNNLEENLLTSFAAKLQILPNVVMPAVGSQRQCK